MIKCVDERKTKRILALILEKIKNKNITWRLEGSVNLKLQGVDVSARDLDITTDENGINIFRDCLSQYMQSYSFKKEIDAFSLVCEIDGCEVEINHPLDDNLLMFDKIQVILWEDMDIPSLPLESAKIFYKLIHREEKVRIISEHLENLNKND